MFHDRLEPAGAGRIGVRGRLVATAAAVLVTTLVCAASEATAGPPDAVALATIVGFYLATAGIITAFAVWTAEELGLPSLLMLSAAGPGERLRRLAMYGLGIGVLVSLVSLLLTGDQGAVLRPWFWRRIQTPVDTLLFSARAAFLEETFFRLFLIPFLGSMAVRTRRPRYRLRLRDGTVRATRTAERRLSLPLLLGAVAGSSLLFGLAHPFNPLSAILLAPLLALAYLRGGWESAVLAHLVSNWLVFSVYF